MSATVRLFAGAADAAGTEEATITVASVGQLRDALATRFGEQFAAVLAQCSLMIDGELGEEGDAIPAGATVDVLPPFAGG